MSTIKTDHHPQGLDVLSQIDPGDAEATAMALAMRDAQQSRKIARARRDAAYQDRIEQLHAAADKLRELANLSIGSGIFQAAVGIGAALCRMPAARATKWADPASEALGAAARADGCQISKDGVQVEKQELETAAEVASQQAERANDQLSEAKRIEGSVKQMLQKLHDRRAAAEESATRL